MIELLISEATKRCVAQLMTCLAGTAHCFEKPLLLMTMTMTKGKAGNRRHVSERVGSVTNSGTEK